jgi:TRAP transporter TAXI family solute receptor
MVKPLAAETGSAKRRLAPALVLAAALSVAWPSAPLTQEISFFRIGTGDTSGTLFAVGSAIASAISNPPGSPCDRGGSCGVPNLVAVAQSTEGAIENVEAIAAGLMESALVRADVAYWAYYGTGPFATQEPLSNLRAIANLYPAVVHIVAVARQGQGISTVSDLAGKRVSLGPKASGTPANAQAILAAYGLLVDDIEASYLDSGLAADRLQAGEIDAVEAVEDLARRSEVMLVPVDAAPRDEITSFSPFLAEADIPSGTYSGLGFAPAVAVGTQFIISADADEELVYELTKSLWHERTRELLESSHPQARQISSEHALERLAIPLHPGAQRYYREQGIHR